MFYLLLETIDSRISFSSQEGEDIFSLSAKAEFKETCNSRLVDILREENAALKKDLETYYQRVRKLQKVTYKAYILRSISSLPPTHTHTRTHTRTHTYTYACAHTRTHTHTHSHTHTHTHTHLHTHTHTHSWSKKLSTYERVRECWKQVLVGEKNLKVH